MHSPIKTIIKNKSNKCFFCSTYPRYQVALRPAGEKGDTVELCGDIFTMMKTRQEIEGLMKSYLNGVIDITFGVDRLFNSTELDANSCVKYPNIVVNDTLSSTEQLEAADKTSTPAESEQVSANISDSSEDNAEKPTDTNTEDTEDNKKIEDTVDAGKVEPQNTEDPVKTSNNRRRSKNIKIG